MIVAFSSKELSMTSLSLWLSYSIPVWIKGLITVGREWRQQHPSDLLSGAGTSRERSSRDVKHSFLRWHLWHFFLSYHLINFTQEERENLQQLYHSASHIDISQLVHFQRYECMSCIKHNECCVNTVQFQKDCCSIRKLSVAQKLLQYILNVTYHINIISPIYSIPTLLLQLRKMPLHLSIIKRMVMSL